MSRMITGEQINVVGAITNLQNSRFSIRNNGSFEFLSQKLMVEHTGQSFAKWSVGKELRWKRQGMKEENREIAALEKVKQSVLKMNIEGNEREVANAAVNRAKSRYNMTSFLSNLALIGSGWMAGRLAVQYLPLTEIGTMITSWTVLAVMAIGGVRILGRSFMTPKKITLFEALRTEILKQLGNAEAKAPENKPVA